MQSAYRLATGGTVRESNSGGGDIQTGPGAQPACYTMATGSLFPGGKSGRGVALTTYAHVTPMLKKE
jgi:hypothetical protein